MALNWHTRGGHPETSFARVLGAGHGFTLDPVPLTRLR